MTRRGLTIVIACVLASAPVMARVQSAATSRSAPSGLPGTAGGGWLEFRGDARNTGVSHGRAPGLSRVRWRFLADSEVLTPPSVAGGRVYFGSRGGTLYAVRADDGAKVWEKTLAARAGDQAYWGFSYSAPLVHAGRVYIGSEDGHLHCVLLETGEPVWRRHLGGSGDTARVWASPKTDGKLVFVGSSSGTLWAFDPATGSVAWKTWLGDVVGASVGILGSDLIVPAKDRRLHVVDAATGVERWHVELAGSSMSSPALVLGLAFLRVVGGRVACVDLATRAVRWSAELTPSSHAQTSVAHDGDRTYVTNGGFVAAITADGNVAWHYRGKAGFDSSPVLAGRVVLLAGNDGFLRTLDKDDGEVVKELDLKDKLVATPAVVEGIAYAAGASGYLYAVE